MNIRVFIKNSLLKNERFFDIFAPLSSLKVLLKNCFKNIIHLANQSAASMFT